jgi:hypothetical protein
MLESSSVATQLAGSQEGLSSTKLVNYMLVETELNLLLATVTALSKQH